MLYFVEIISLSASGCLTSDNQKKKKIHPPPTLSSLHQTVSVCRNSWVKNGDKEKPWCLEHALLNFNPVVSCLLLHFIE